MDSNELYIKLINQEADLVNYFLVRDKKTGKFIGKLSRLKDDGFSQSNSIYLQYSFNNNYYNQNYYNNVYSCLLSLRADIQNGFDSLKSSINNLSGILLEHFKNSDDYFLKLQRISYNLNFLSSDDDEDIKEIKKLKKELLDIIVDVRSLIQSELANLNYSSSQIYILRNFEQNLLFFLYLAYQELFHVLLSLKKENSNSFSYIHKAFGHYNDFLLSVTNRLIFNMNNLLNRYNMKPVDYFPAIDSVNIITCTCHNMSQDIYAYVNVINCCVNYIHNSRQQERILEQDLFMFTRDVSGEAVIYENDNLEVY